ncbi:agamous-like MADS-box protein AGL29 [Mercurialis annua]|uniref:agamous-like MADS-box protein AGL29 n=1 Tax=Mercurialis annua TaxID=3986 RepID=UPI0021600696|nr:agamous-like MADS-box protein AGL29 [Mercurialis annua]
MVAPKKTRMSLIEGASARQASFSKRRTGIFKKASELCTLCDAEAAVVIFSPGGKPYCFGHPCFEAIMEKVADPGNPDNGYAQHMAERQARIHDLRKQYADMLQQVKAEKKRGDELEQMTKAETEKMALWDRPLETLNFEELMTLKSMVEQAQAKVAKRFQELSAQDSDPSASTSGNSGEALDPSATDAEVTDADTSGNFHGSSP